jgi:Flp pilus assembly protein TadG
MTTPTQSGGKNCLFPSLLSFGLHRLRDDQQGTIAIMTGLSARVLVAFAALAISAQVTLTNRSSSTRTILFHFS